MSGQLTGSLEDTTSLGGFLHDVRLDYYGRKAASASGDNTVRIWDVADGQMKPAAELKGGHEGPVWKVTWAHPKFGSIIASCGYDMKVIIWKEVQANAWQIAYMDSSHAASVNDVEFCPLEYGLSLACASSDGTVSILSYQYDGSWRRTAFPAHAGGVQALSWAPGPGQNRDAVPAPTIRLVTGGCDNAVCVWKCEGEAWAQESPPLAHSDWVRAVAWRPDGVAVIASGSWDKSVCVWKQDMEGQPWRQVCKLSLSDKVEGLSWSATGSILAVSFGESETSLYKEAIDGRYEEIGKVNEPGFVEVPNSFTAATQMPQSMPAPVPEPASKLSDELQQQQQAVLDSFGM